jgi:hypothetical protein
MNPKTLFRLSAMFIFVCLISACAGGQIANHSEEKIISTQPNLPAAKWVDGDAVFWSDEIYYYCKGVAQGETNLQTSIASASNAAKQAIIEQIKTRGSSIIKIAIEAGISDSKTGKTLENIYISKASNLSLSAATISEVYSRNIASSDGKTQKTFYRSYALSRIKISDYKQMQELTFNRTASDPQTPKTKEAKNLLKLLELEIKSQNPNEDLSTLNFKNPTALVFVSIFLGSLGIDRFAVGDTGLGVIKLLTGGGGGLWWLIDIFLIKDRAKQVNREMIIKTLVF